MNCISQASYYSVQSWEHFYVDPGSAAKEAIASKCLDVKADFSD